MRYGTLVVTTLLLVALTGCGYRLAARKGDVGAGQTIAVPTFGNTTNSYRIEQGVSEAIRRELARNTHYKVTSLDSGDVVVRGEVVSYSISPTVFDERGRATQYVLALQLKLLVTESSTKKELYRHDGLLLRDTFQLSQAAAEFVPEEPAALNRMAERFAAMIVAALVHRPS
jgi:hypothetical protein